MATPDLLSNMRAHLISEGVVREPRTAGADPPCWLEPMDGAPAPGDREGTEDSATAVAALFRTGGIPPAVSEQRYFMQPTVDVVLRTDKPPTAVALQEEISRAILAPSGNPGSHPGMNWTMGALTVIDSRLWRDWQPLDFDEQAYTVVGSFFFQLYAS